MLFNSTYWIVDTDYDNYALVYGCREEAANGTCVDPVGFMWTRCPNPKSEYVELMERKLPALCLTPQEFINTYQKQGNLLIIYSLYNAHTSSRLKGIPTRLSMAFSGRCLNWLEIVNIITLV